MMIIKRKDVEKEEMIKKLS